MTNSSLTSQIDRASLVKKMAVGAAIGLALISFFLISAGEGSPEWGKFWMVRPLVIVSLSGAAGGAFYYFMVRGFKSEGARLTAIVVSVIVYIIGLWLGTVLGLDGTYWN